MGARRAAHQVVTASTGLSLSISDSAASFMTPASVPPVVTHALRARVNSTHEAAEQGHMQFNADQGALVFT